ncbi:MAG: hypothetical protein R2867_37965 [Caldilineaceae bacterium]
MALVDHTYEILVMDDNSPDGMAQVVSDRYGTDTVGTAATLENGAIRLYAHRDALPIQSAMDWRRQMAALWW